MPPLASEEMERLEKAAPFRLLRKHVDFCPRASATPTGTHGRFVRVSHELHIKKQKKLCRASSLCAVCLPSCGARLCLRRKPPCQSPTAAPARPPCIRPRRRSVALPAPVPGAQASAFLPNKTKKTGKNLSFLFGGDGETRTLAPVTRPTPLAGAPRHQLEYISVL